MRQIMTLRGWQQRRVDPGTEAYWKKKALGRVLNAHEKYQQKYNFIETDYSARPSNNGLDLKNPGFAFTTNLARYLKMETVR